MVPGMRNDGDGERFRIRFHDGEADSVYSYGSFWNQVLCELRRNGDRQNPCVVLVLDRLDGSRPVDMPLYEVAANSLAGGEGPLEVHPLPRARAFKTRTGDGFRHRVESEVHAFARDRGQADSVDRNAIAHLH